MLNITFVIVFFIAFFVVSLFSLFVSYTPSSSPASSRGCGAPKGGEGELAGGGCATRVHSMGRGPSGLHSAETPEESSAGKRTLIRKAMAVITRGGREWMYAAGWRASAPTERQVEAWRNTRGVYEPNSDPGAGPRKPRRRDAPRGTGPAPRRWRAGSRRWTAAGPRRGWATRKRRSTPRRGWADLRGARRAATATPQPVASPATFARAPSVDDPWPAAIQWPAPARPDAVAFDAGMACIGPLCLR